jgi:nucleotide-binding universal stress UspA family protein
MNVQRILVPLDGSPLAEDALPKAVELVQGSAGKLFVLRAVEAHAFPGADRTEAQVKVVKEAEDYLGQIRDRLAALGVKDVDISIWYGPATDAIVEAVSLYKIDQIVMTTHGRSGLGRLILGSVAESVLRGTTTPILLLRASEAPVERPTGTAKPWPGIGHA